MRRKNDPLRRPRQAEPKKDEPEIANPEPGLPAAQTTLGNNLPRPDRDHILCVYNEEGAMRNSLANRIDAALGVDCAEIAVLGENVRTSLTELYETASSPARFDSAEQFEQTLQEGLLLRVNTMVSNAIGLPCGEYMVFRLAPKSAVLVPTDLKTESAECTKKPQSYEIHRQKLATCWNNLQRSIAEADDDEESPKQSRTYSHKTAVQQADSTSVHPRRPKVKAAMSSSGDTQEKMAERLGVDPSTVSRWTCNDEESGRIPSLAHAIELSDAAGVPIDSMFSDLEPAERKATSGSGGGRNKTYRRGNRHESTERGQAVNESFGKRNWSGVSGTLTLEVMLEDGEWWDIGSGDVVPPEVSNAILKYFGDRPAVEDQPARQAHPGIAASEPFLVEVNFSSSGYYDPGVCSGPPERCYPPEGSDERTIDSVDITPPIVGAPGYDNRHRVVLDDQEAGAIFDRYEDKINDQDLGDHDSEDYRDYD